MDKIGVKTAETIKLKILEATPGMIYGRLLRNPRHFFGGIALYCSKRRFKNTWARFSCSVLYWSLSIESLSGGVNISSTSSNLRDKISQPSTL